MTALDENAQNWQRLQTYQSKKAHLTNVRSRARELGADLGMVGQALSTNPSKPTIRIRSEYIEVLQYGQKEPQRLALETMSLESLKGLLADIEQTETELERLRKELSDVGVDITKPLG